MAAALTNDNDSNADLVRDGLRPFHPATDLLPLADLMELGFVNTMDESGRAVIREMRALGRAGWLAEAINRMENTFGGLPQGFIWLEAGQMISNVSIMPVPYPRAAEGGATGAIIANVVTHPDYQRRGIARSLLMRSLDLIRERGCAYALLQVDWRNEGAQRLYASLGFRVQRAFTRWLRPARLSAPYALPDMPPITLRSARDWRLEYALTQRARPDSQGGLGWLRPTYISAFRPSLLGGVANMLTGRANESWAIYSPNRQAIFAAIRLSVSFGSPNRFDLLVQPDMAGRYEKPLLNYLLRRLDDRYRPLITEHPRDDALVSQLLADYDFEPRRTEITMRLDFPTIRVGE